MELQFQNIPTVLSELNQWVVWRYDGDEGDLKKVPYQCNGRRARSNDPTTWSTFSECRAVYETGGWEGVGFMFSADDPYCGIDLDGCRDPENGQTTPWAVEWLTRFQSYCEVSPSETGWKVFLIGTNTKGTGANK